MSTIIVPIFGAVICFVVPLTAFAAGIYYARYGLPLHVRWRGFGRSDDDD